MARRWTWTTWTWLGLSVAPVLALWAGIHGRHADRDAGGYAMVYALRLTSDWPVYPHESDACNNRSDEVLEGTVQRIAEGRYAGRFARASRLGFCGAHGRDQATICGLELRGRDTVEVMAQAFDDGRGPGLRLRWQGVPGVGTVAVGGTCSERFEQAMTHLYLHAVHEVEVPVTPAVVGRGRVQLSEYPWTVAVTLPRATDSLDLPNTRPAADR